MKGGGETTIFNTFAYTWDSIKKCVITKILTQDAEMLKVVTLFVDIIL